MAPKRTPAQRQADADAKTQKHLLRARQEQYKMQIFLVNAALKAHAELADGTIKYLTGQGVNFEALQLQQGVSTTLGGASGGVDMAQPVEAGDGSAKSTKSEHLTEADLDHASDSLSARWGKETDMVLSGCFTTVDIIGTKLKLAMMRTSEPRAMHDNMTNLLAPVGKKKVPKHMANQVFEYMYGLAPDEHILALWHAAGVFQMVLDSLNVQRGRLILDLPLPPDWCSDGLFGKQVAEGDVCLVTCKLVKVVARQVPESFLRGVDLSTLHIQSNFSHRNARLCDGSGALNFPLLTLFPEAEAVVKIPVVNAGGVVKQDPAAKEAAGAVAEAPQQALKQSVQQKRMMTASASSTAESPGQKAVVQQPTSDGGRTPKLTAAALRKVQSEVPATAPAPPKQPKPTVPSSRSAKTKTPAVKIEPEREPTKQEQPKRRRTIGKTPDCT